MAITAGSKLGGYNEADLGPGLKLFVFNLVLDGAATEYDTGHNLIWVAATEKEYDSATSAIAMDNALTATVYDTASESLSTGSRFGTIALSGAGTATDEIIVIGIGY